ncbi:MAG: type I-E CRISPR-associated protein Cas5/CasD [Chloroflexota bacterium]|nr:type I-E CRISPR-associated protein Cas5/CasD [Chloroflexota bacterium]
MGVLFLRLCASMQSWGTQSRFTNRDTELEPSKSGVVGLVCAARGIPRDDLSSLEKLAALKMGVRVDREGVMKHEYHTALNVAKAGGGTKDCEPSHRFYLSDACFLVALQGEATLLEGIHYALRRPVWQLYLGRKSFVPGLPIWLEDGLKRDATDLKKALGHYPYLCRERPREEEGRRLRLELEVPFGQGERVKHDQPISFQNGNRRFGLRHVVRDSIDLESLPPAEREELCTFLA